MLLQRPAIARLASFALVQLALLPFAPSLRAIPLEQPIDASSLPDSPEPQSGTSSPALQPGPGREHTVAGDPSIVIYVGNATTIQRIPYHSGDLHATGPVETIVPNIPGYAQLTGGGHWTRDVAFTKDGRHMLVSVGSGSNMDDPDTHPKEFHRADVLEFTPDGKFIKVYASGIRNCVGEAINPITGQLWCSTNERDNLGNHLVPDYVTSIKEGGFYGWPWYYMGGHQDPRLDVLSGSSYVRWGEKGEFNATLHAGDFLFVPAWLPHQEINPSSEEPFQWIVVRSTSEPIVVNLPDDFWGDIDSDATHLRVEG